MRITFVLPAPIRIPMGGAKVVYAHAAGLAKRGHRVVVAAPRRGEDGGLARARELAVRVRDRWHGVRAAPYYEAEGVETRVVPTVSEGTMPDADAVIATGSQTAPWVHRLPPSKGTPFYFIQGYETFVGPEALATWHLPMARLTCARWLRDEVEAAGESVLGVVPNAIDPAEFFAELPIEGRPPRVVALYHRHPVKGPDVLLEALAAIRQRRPEAEADVFAARPPSHRFPSWVRVHVRPSLVELRALYNGAALLLHPSRSEGWPLVPMEAAACGCAVVASANPGVREYLTDGGSMRVAPVGDGAALGAAALDLLANEEERVRLAGAARHAVATYRWPELTSRLDTFLSEGLGRG